MFKVGQIVKFASSNPRRIGALLRINGLDHNGVGPFASVTIIKAKADSGLTQGLKTAFYLKALAPVPSFGEWARTKGAGHV